MNLHLIGILLDLVAGTGGGGIRGGLYRWYMERKTRHWPVTPVTIVGKRADRLHKVTLSFHYTVDGEMYGGFYKRSFPNAAAARRYLEHFGNGLPTFARYDPRRRERSWIRI